MTNGGPGSRVGTRFGPYQLIRLLGHGGMGEVYQAEDVRKHRVVALKLISPRLSGDPVLRARIQREADTAGRLNEPHVVPIHDYGEIDGQFFVEMRLIDGNSLRTILDRYGPLSPPRAVALIRQVAAALDAAHGAGVMHRDVKPENIVVTDDDFVYLVDFGIARAENDPGLTEIGTTVGTCKYMAPERFTGADVTYRADIYSLACVLDECLTGVPPYRADSIERMVAAHLTEQPPRPSEMRPGAVPAALDRVIARGMAKKPEDRYRSAGEFAVAAHEALTQPDQDQAVTILRHSEEAARRDAGAASGPGSWRTGPSAGPSFRERPDFGDRVNSGPPPPAVVRPPAPARPSAPARSPATEASLDGETMMRPAGGDRSPAGWRGQQSPAVSRPAQTNVAGGGTHKWWIPIGAVVLALVSVIGLVTYLLTRSSDGSGSGQSELQFTGINFRLSPGGVAVNGSGDVYVTNQGMYGRVMKLPGGSSTPIVLPFSGLYQPQGVVVDSNDTVYVSDFNNRVVKLTAGSNNQIVLPFTGLNYPEGVAVDNAGGVYVADRGNNRVLKLPAGANTATALPFSGLSHPDGVAVDRSGTVYVADTDNNRVVKLAAGSSDQQVLPFTGVSVPWGVAVDDNGGVYVTEHDANKVLKLPAGASTSTTLPFSGLNTPLDIAVDKNGTVYVADRGNNRVVKLAQ
ncbi:MAG TPA: serine/threonine-protein kinase PknD [Mycobacterium sp.]|nr:serine/threonine-protein kinase PknD [Mycobacterium sp.]